MVFVPFNMSPLYAKIIIFLPEEDVSQKEKR